MPTKHIPDATWKKVEKELVRAVISTKKPLKDTQILNKLILIGLKHVTDKDYEGRSTESID